MCPTRVLVFLTTLLLVKKGLVVHATKGCSSSTRESVLHISPPVITPSPSSSLHKLQGRDEIPHLTLDVNPLTDLVKRSVHEGTDCRNNVVRRRENITEGDVIGEAGVSKIVRKKTVISEDEEYVEDEVKPAKRVLNSAGVSSKPIKKSLDPVKAASLSGLIKKTMETSKGPTGLSSLIQAMKNKAISSLLTNINSNTKTGARKSQTESPKSKLESFLASASGADTKSDTPAAKSDLSAITPKITDDGKPKTDIKVAEAGKSILAAIDDKEGLRAALAKAIDRVEKVVANKNGALKELAEKKQDDNKATGVSRSSDTSSNSTATPAASNSTQTKSETKTETKTDADKPTNATTKSTESSNSDTPKDTPKVSSNSTSDASNTTTEKAAVKEESSSANKTEAAPAPPPAPVVHDPYAEIAMGPDKPKIPELKGEEESATSQPGVMKLGGEGAPAEGGASAGAGGGGAGDKPLAGMHDVGGLLDSLTDKVNLAGTDTKAMGGAPGLPDAMSTMLDRAQDKLNGLGGDMASDGQPAPNNEVKYMQSQMPDPNGASDDGSPKLLGDPTATSKDTMAPKMQPPMMGGAAKMMGDDAAMKALAGGGGGGGERGDEEMGGGRGGGASSEIKPMEKEDVFNNMLKNQGTDSDDEGSMKNFGGMKEDSHMKDDNNDGNDDGNDMPPHMTSHMHKHQPMDEDENAPMTQGKGGPSDVDSSEGLVKDIMDKAGALNTPPKGAGDDFKEFQGADITPGPDPYENDKTGDSYGSMYGPGGVGGRMKGAKPFREEDSYDADMSPAGHGLPEGAGGAGDGMQGFGGPGPHGAPGGGPGDFGDGYNEKGGNDFDGPPRESIESNDDQQMPGRGGDGGARGLDSYLNMAAVSPLGPDTFQTRQVIPEHGWRSSVTGGRAAGGSFHDNYNAQLFKRNVIMRPEKDFYQSPFQDKTSYDVEQ